LERSRNYATLSLRFFSISGNLFPDIESLRRDVHCDTGKMLRVMITGAFLYQNDVGVKRYFDPFDTRLLRALHSRNPQNHFSLKNGYLLMFLAGQEVKNPLASKLALDF